MDYVTRDCGAYLRLVRVNVIGVTSKRIIEFVRGYLRLRSQQVEVL